eukprot:3934625-Rhodomonas_salina.2
MPAHGCRHCHAAATGCDVTRLPASELSYAAVVLGHSPASLAALVLDMERTHVLGVTLYCPSCALVSLSLATLPETPTTAHVCECIRDAAETRELHGILAAQQQ